MCRNQGINDLIHIAAGQIMCLELIDLHIQPGFIRLDERQDDFSWRYPAHPHTNQCNNINLNISSQGRYPQPQWNKMQKYHDYCNHQH